MKADFQNPSDKDYKRVLIYCSSKEQLNETLTSLPIIEGYWDAFDNHEEAVKAIQNGDYGIVFCESTMLNPSDRDLVMAANSKSANVHSFYSSGLTRTDVVADIWNLEESYFFRHIGKEQDGMTVALYPMFTEPSHLKWFSHVQCEFHAMREKVTREKTQTVLLTGANGTGKFTLAQIAHIRSDRRNNRFIFANCRTIGPKRVMKWGDSEKSHFIRILKSMVRQADGGTLYFHEIDQLDMEAQELVADYLVKELEINTDRSKFNGMFICSTRINIEDSIPGYICSAKLVRAICRNIVKIPSLMDYHEDMELLAIEVLKNYCISSNIPEKVFGKSALKAICSHVWTRNLRELFDVVKHAVMITPNKRITEDSIVMHPVLDVEDSYSDKLRKVKHALRDNNGNKRRAAKTLEIAPKTLYVWMRELGIPLNYK